MEMMLYCVQHNRRWAKVSGGLLMMKVALGKFKSRLFTHVMNTMSVHKQIISDLIRLETARLPFPTIN